MRGGWQAEKDGSFTMGSHSRKLKPPPATPWAKLTEEWRSNVSQDFYWKGRLSEVLKAAAETKARSGGKPEPWPSPEAFLVRWAKAHRWTVNMDTVNDLVTIRPMPDKQAPIRKSSPPGVSQPSLFDVNHLATGSNDA